MSEHYITAMVINFTTRISCVCGALLTSDRSPELTWETHLKRAQAGSDE